MTNRAPLPSPSAPSDRLRQLGVKGPETIPFGSQLKIQRYTLENGLTILLCVDKTAPVIAYHTWFRVGSRHEHRGKTGLAHLFEHLMFNAMEGLPPGEFDRRMEAAGADNNASTWLDFTQYQEAFPKAQLKKIVQLESLRMHKLVLGQKELDSEKEVVSNERRFRVEDDVEGQIDELLYKTAFEVHPYHWPTIGWMDDIQSFTVEDCLDFYRRYYSPQNASLILVGDLSIPSTLELLAQHYGPIASAELPTEEITFDPPQIEERRVEVTLPTPTDKLTIGYKGPSLGDEDHIATSLLMEVLTGGDASRLRRRLIRDVQFASDVRGSVGPHKDPSLIEFGVAAREGISANALLDLVDAEIARVVATPVEPKELDRARARMRLGLLGGLETADGKASTIGFYEAVLRRPAAAFERLRAMDLLEPSDLLRAARRYLRKESRTLVLARAASPSDRSPSAEEAPQHP